MYIKREILSKISTESFLLGILHLIGLLSLYRDDDNKRGRPYLYPTTVILRCYLVRIWMRIPSNNCLHQYFCIDRNHNQRIMRACGLHALSDRRTFDRRFKVLPIYSMICIMGERFVMEKIADCTITSVDSSMIHAKGYKVWHKSDIKSGTVRRSGIDTDARWGFSGTKGWIYGYKLHMSCSTGSLVVPLSAGITPANIPDNQMYQHLTEQLPNTVQYVIADAGYDDWKLYDYTRQRGARLVCPVRRYHNTKGERLKLVAFYQSRKGQMVYGNRGVSVEPLFCTIKDTFRTDPSPVIGFENVSPYILMCIFVYQISVYYNCIVGSDKPRCVRYMLGN
jgi:hypothetical protein